MRVVSSTHNDSVGYFPDRVNSIRRHSHTMKTCPSHFIHKVTLQSPTPETVRCVWRDAAKMAVLALASTLGALLLVAPQASATVFSFSTGDHDGLIATLSRPPSPGVIQTETADDFILTDTTFINQATFTGLIPSGAA